MINLLYDPQIKDIGSYDNMICVGVGCGFFSIPTYLLLATSDFYLAWVDCFKIYFWEYLSIGELNVFLRTFSSNYYYAESVWTYNNTDYKKTVTIFFC